MITEKPKMYWQEEEPVIAYGERQMLVLFPKARKLQVAVIWDGANNPRKQGKTITLSGEDMNQSMREVLQGFLEAVS